ncbi:MAG: AMP-binding protein [Lachnospiraceae bacterium]|nr:AMP-binding protein [Lachnospiraceae bacterium]MDY4970513.1 AMP-binding protein [Lachnospiraceae bacterium]
MTKMIEKYCLSGKPSIDRPWLKYYPDQLLQIVSRPSCTVTEYLKRQCPGMEVAAIEYYGEQISWKEIFDETEKTAAALKTLGFNEGDQIPVFLKLVPEFLPLLLAAEKIGASILCRDNTLEENVEAVIKSGASVIFVHDYISQEELNAFEHAGVTRFILINPLNHGHRESMPDYIQTRIDSLYPLQAASSPCIMYWDNFLNAGNFWTGPTAAPVDINRPLFRAYTSGSTGPSKQVIHSADSMISTVCQMNFYCENTEKRSTWLVTCLPPALVAVVVSMVLLPLSSDRLLIMDPFVAEKDVDLEVMRYKANNWPTIPMFIETLMRNGRMDEDYDLSHLLAMGPGCEAYNNNQIQRTEKFLHNHNCNIRLTTGYGCSEAGSSITLPMSPHPVLNGNAGVPMPLNIISIFKPSTQEELSYNQIGEICISGPGTMLGYDDEESTSKVLQYHDDGRKWLHLGDLGYMNEDGVLYVVTRGASPRYGGGDLAVNTMENLVADANIEGIDDEFFVVVPDNEHPGYFLPYLYVSLFDGYTVDDIRKEITNCLKEYMLPVKIFSIPERPFFHFKTNRIGLMRELQEKQYA